jgi:hypothetical protein
MKKILFICGSLNQTTMMHEISKHFENDYECWFTQFYTDGILEWARKRGLLDFTILGGEFFKQTTCYLKEKTLKTDYQCKQNKYDLVFTCSDLIVPDNIKQTPIILVQEGMTDPETLMYYLVKYLKLPRYLASTSTSGLSDSYNYFCVASEGYRDLFIKKGVKKEKIAVTGIPNFDDISKYSDKDDFLLKNFVLVATSDARETFKYENRTAFIKKAVKIAGGKQLIFKLHPNEKAGRATKEIRKIVPDALIFHSGNINPLIANCSKLITRYSSVVYIGISLGKEVYSEFDINQLRKMTPIQNGGTSAGKIADVGKKILEGKKLSRVKELKSGKLLRTYSELSYSENTI